jgi:hypothetical protein
MGTCLLAVICPARESKISATTECVWDSLQTQPGPHCHHKGRPPPEEKH